MENDASAFDKITDQFHISSSSQDIIPLNRNGATSDCFKVRLYAKWHFLKRPKKIFAGNPVYLHAFEKEFDLGYSLDHPNIVSYLNKGNDKEGVYMLTEYIDGETLDHFLKLNPGHFRKKSNADRFLLQLLSALDYLHERQIVHLDIKPANIMLTKNGAHVKLIDLGMSYSDCYSELTGGSRGYGSPEQFIKDYKVDFRSDMYGVGKLLLYIFTGGTTMKNLRKLPYQYKNIVRQCLRENINQRNITARKCIDIIEKNRKIRSFRWLLLPVAGLLLYFAFIIRQKTLPEAKTLKESSQEITSTDSSQIDFPKTVNLTERKQHLSDFSALQNEKQLLTEPYQTNATSAKRRISWNSQKIMRENEEKFNKEPYWKGEINRIVNGKDYYYNRIYAEIHDPISSAVFIGLLDSVKNFYLNTFDKIYLQRYSDITDKTSYMHFVHKQIDENQEKYRQLTSEYILIKPTEAQISALPYDFLEQIQFVTELINRKERWME